MPFNTEDPYNRLKTHRPAGRASEALAIMRSEAPLELMHASQRPDSALDLPLWRPGVANVPSVPEPVAVEQTDIMTVMAHVTERAHKKAFSDLRNEIIETCRLEKVDMRATYLSEQRDMYAAMRELDAWAMGNGFTTAAARHVGSRLANKELTPEDALAEIVALG